MSILLRQSNELRPSPDHEFDGWYRRLYSSHHLFSFLPFRRVKIGFPSDVRRTQVEDIAVLAAGQQIAMPIEMVLSGLAGRH